MLRNLLLTIILLSAPASLWAKESFQKDFEQACQLRREGKLEEALTQFQALNKAKPQKSAILYGLAGVQALLGNYGEAMTHLKIALRYDRDLKQGYNWGDFIRFVDQPEWHEVEAMVSKNLSFKKKALAIQLWKMKIIDQAYYWHMEQVGLNSPIALAIWDLKHILNDKNQQKIIQLIAEYGWPKRSEVGQVASVAFLIIQHASYDLQKRYLPLLEKACQAGEAYWADYALMYDRIKVHENGKQLYGSQLISDGKGFEPIEDVEHINERRLSKGLEPIEDYAASWGIDWEKALLQMKQEQRKTK